MFVGCEVAGCCKVHYAADNFLCCFMADGQSAPTVKARSARRWLARNAAGIKRIRCRTYYAASSCASLVFCLPALEDAKLLFYQALTPNELSCLLEALAWSPRLRALDLCMMWRDEEWTFIQPAAAPIAASGCAAAFAQLRSLTKLALSFDKAEPYTLADVVAALVPLTGLAELTLGFIKDVVVPAALGQLKGLRSLELHGLRSCAVEAGCFDLPNLACLVFPWLWSRGYGVAAGRHRPPEPHAH